MAEDGNNVKVDQTVKSLKAEDNNDEEDLYGKMVDAVKSEAVAFHFGHAVFQDIGENSFEESGFKR